MDKATFLVQLQKNIGMLDDGEQKDIIDEYSQHIDMKVSGGMTEAEAIEDFGDFNEFVREILSAYHVKAPFDQPDAVEAKAAVAQPTAGDRLDDAVRAGSNAVGKAAAATKSGAHKLGEAVSGAFGKAKDRARASAQRAQGSSASVSAPAAAGASEGLDAGAALGGATGVASASSIRAWLSKAWRVCLRVVKTCARWLWNVCVACCAAFCLILGLASLFCFGVFAVLLAQGYPMLGVTVAGAGASMMFGAAAFLLIKLIARKPARDAGASFEVEQGGGAATSQTGARPVGGAPVVGSHDEPAAVPEETKPLAFSASDRRREPARRGGAAPSSMFTTAPLYPSRFDTMPLGNKGGAWHD